MPTPAPWARVRVGATCVHSVTLESMLEYCASTLSCDEQAVVLNVNAHAVVLAETNADFRDALAAADVVFCDGAGVSLAARWLGRPLPARFTPPDWVDRLGQICVAAGRPIFLLGSTAEIVKRAGEKLHRMVPDLEIYTHHGYFEKNGPANEAVIAQISAVRPGALLVGFGMPAQELWITAHRTRLNANLLLAVGGMFDYLSGAKQRGPRWLSDWGLEWLYRLLREPRRLWRRYLLGLPRFAWIVARQKFERR